MRIEIQSNNCVVIVDAKADDNTVNKEFYMKRALHSIIKEYKKEFGFELTQDLMRELRAYHTAKVIE